MASNIKASTQQHIDIEDVLDNIIIHKDGSCALVLKTNALNFGLLSEEEQDATIYAYAAFLNSLTFSVQILIRSDLKDISGYLRLLEEQEIKQSNPMKKQQIYNYRHFVEALITERNVLEKSFYLVIPFSPLELGVSQSFSSAFFKSKSSLPFEKSYILEKAKASLEPKRDHLLAQLGRIGLAARQLSTQELIQLLFSMYNASSTQGQKITNTNDYTVPLVQPAYIRPKEEFMSDQSPVNTTPATEPTTTATPPATPTPTPTPEPLTLNTPPEAAAPTPQPSPSGVPQETNTSVTPPQATTPVQPPTPTATPTMTPPVATHTPSPAPVAPAMNVPSLTPPTPAASPTTPATPTMTPPVATPTPSSTPVAPTTATPAIPPTPEEINPLDAQDAINSAASDLTQTGQ